MLFIGPPHGTNTLPEIAQLTVGQPLRGKEALADHEAPFLTMHFPSVRRDLAGVTLTCSQHALHLCSHELERICPTSSSGPVVSHNHMLRPKVYLSCQLSRDRNTKDSCDSGGMSLIVRCQNSNCVSVTGKH